MLIRLTLHKVGWWPTGLEPRFMPDLSLPKSRLLTDLRVIDLVSSPVWLEAATNISNEFKALLFANFYKIMNLVMDIARVLDYHTHLSLSLSIYIYIYIYIIIIMSCHQHGYPWPSLATSPYRSSSLAGLRGYILYPHIAAVCMFELVVLLLLGHRWGSIRVHHLWTRPCFSSSVLHVWFV